MNQKSTATSTADEAEQHAAQLFKDAVACLAEQTGVSGEPPRRFFFPDGIQLIEIKVTVGTATVSIRVSGSKNEKPELQVSSPPIPPDALDGQLGGEVSQTGASK
jgi:hypothetical protein